MYIATSSLSGILGKLSDDELKRGYLEIKEDWKPLATLNEDGIIRKIHEDFNSGRPLGSFIHPIQSVVDGFLMEIARRRYE